MGGWGALYEESTAVEQLGLGLGCPTQVGSPNPSFVLEIILIRVRFLILLSYSISPSKTQLLSSCSSYSPLLNSIISCYCCSSPELLFVVPSIDLSHCVIENGIPLSVLVVLSLFFVLPLFPFVAVKWVHQLPPTLVTYTWWHISVFLSNIYTLAKTGAGLTTGGSVYKAQGTIRGNWTFVNGSKINFYVDSPEGYSLKGICNGKIYLI